MRGAGELVAVVVDVVVQVDDEDDDDDDRGEDELDEVVAGEIALSSSVPHWARAKMRRPISTTIATHPVEKLVEVGWAAPVARDVD